MTAEPVPMCDVAARYAAHQADVDAAVGRVLRGGQAILGPEVAAFEAEAAGYLGCEFAVGVADGTNALLLALTALDIGPGDEVIVPPFTFFATAASVVRVGATPVFADIDPVTFNLDPAAVAAAVGPRTKAVMPVHLFGQAADMGGLMRVAAAHDLLVIEDAAQAFGADYRGRKVGTLGAVGCFSFYPSKNLGTFGDAGLVATDDPHLAARLKALRGHGCEVKYHHRWVGWNARLDAVHAAVLRALLPHVDGWLAARRAAADRYDGLIAAAGLNGWAARPARTTDGGHTFNQYTVRVPAADRDKLVDHLKGDRVGCDIYYPVGLHRQECFRGRPWAGGLFPATDDASREVVSLPMFPEITAAQQRRVVDACAAFVARRDRRLAA